MPKGKRGARDTQTDPAAAARDAQFDELLGTLSTISGSLGAIALRLAPERKKMKTQGDQIRYLRNLGLGKKAIAAILATTEATVAVRLTEGKASKKSSGKAGRGGRRRARAKR